MSLSDQIIDHGRWWPGQSVREVLVNIVDCEQLNALRDELIAARAARHTPQWAAIVRPGDTLILGFPGILSAAQAHQIKARCEQVLEPLGVEILIVSGADSITVVRPDAES